jgi:RNA polymerase sigma-70 factor (ECF subfamily)
MEPAPPESRRDRERWFEELMALHGPALSRLAASFTRSRGEREDLVQDIALAVWGALPGFRGECSERTFLFRIAHNRAMSYLARRPQPMVNVVDIDDGLETADAASDPERALGREQRRQRLADAVRQLPIGYAQVVMLTLEGMSYSEIAEVLGITETNVGAAPARARPIGRPPLGTGP